MVLCTICNIVSMCTSCIDFQGQEEMKALNFQCPPCFVKQDSNGIYVCQPYIQVIEQCLHCHLATYPLCCFLYWEIWPKILVTPLVIISIQLEGMTDIPSLMAYHLSMTGFEEILYTSIWISIWMMFHGMTLHIVLVICLIGWRLVT